MSEKKERPILFSTPMVQALLNGTKTQTRRVVKPQPPFNSTDENPTFDYDYGEVKGSDEYPALFCEWDCDLIPGENSVESHCVFSPYGKVGDILWVRETFAKIDENIFIYKANENQKAMRWKPSIHMPKAAARIFLEITEIKVERLNDISEADAISEGISKYQSRKMGEMWKDYDTDGGCFDPICSYQSLWVKINGLESLYANPWVWVVKFKIIKP